MGLSSPAPLLRVLDVLALEAEFGDDATEEWRRVLQRAQHVDEGSIVKSKSGEVLDLLDAGHLLYQAVVDSPQEAHEAVLLACRLDAGDYFGTLLPLGDEGRYELDRILEIAAEHYYAITVELAHTIEGRVELAEVLGVEYGLDPPVLSANTTQEGSCIICRAVVDEDELPFVVRH